jgi:lantibiotic leader peptide-processing serine protease
MKRKTFLTLTVSLFFFLVIGAMGFSHSWIVSSKSDKLPDGLAARIQQLGGTLIRSMTDAGIAVAEFPDRASAKSLEALNVEVMADPQLQWIPDQEEFLILNDGQQMDVTGTTEPYYRYQWHLPVIQADKVWARGVLGQGARVAVIDSGIWYPHPDLADNIDYAASATFVPGTTDFIDDRGHGTHVAGIIAAESNNFGSMGIAPRATLIAIKSVASNGTGNVSWLIAGIEHAVAQHADIINLSLGTVLDKNGYEPYYTADDVKAIVKVYRKAINYAALHGSLVVCALGNEGINLDQEKNLIVLPAEAGVGIAVSATGPTGLQNFDTPASYTNYGRSAVYVAAPGGDNLLYPAAGWYYDMVFSTTINGWSWMSGTSMAAPMVSGEAALLVSKYGRVGAPALMFMIACFSDDLGKRGRDAYYGWGRINCFKAVFPFGF